MKNRDLQATWAYHNGTKHSSESIRTNRHYLDWENQPIPFKIYSELESIPLPQQLSSSGTTALEAISSFGSSDKRSSRSLDSDLGGNPLSICRDHQTQELSGRRDTFSRGGLYRRALPYRSLSRLRRSARFKSRSLSLWPAGLCPAAAA